MLLDQMLVEARTLPEVAWPELARFIAFPHVGYGAKESARLEDDARPIVRSLDPLKGGLRFMNDDFDEILSCFEEYV